MAGQTRKSEPFKKTYVAALAKIKESRMSVNERLVYDSLTRMSDTPHHGRTDFLASRPRAEIATETGLSKANVKVTMHRLRERTFFWNGVEIPVIELVESGHRNCASVYRDNLTAYVHHPDSEPLKLFETLEGPNNQGASS